MMPAMLTIATILLEAFSVGADGHSDHATTADADYAARLEANPCACKFQGQRLDSDTVTNYPTSDPGMYENFSGIARYGTFCAAHDYMAGTPWKESYCSGEDFSIPAYNWCQAPWCYVDSSCPTAVASSVFAGSTTAYYSYATCAAADCYSNGVVDKTDWSGEDVPSGCPYDPTGAGTYKIFKSDCECLYHGEELSSSIYTNYPENEPGKYNTAEYLDIQYYGSTCAAWDQAVGTPWYSYCPLGADWCHRDYNWCQAPWCYVSSSCSTKVPSSVFTGSTATFYSYDTCLTTPDCYTDIAFNENCELDNIPAECPFDNTTNGWYTAHSPCDGFSRFDCPDSTFRAGRGFAVLLTFLAVAERFAMA